MNKEYVLAFLQAHKDELYQKYSVTKLGLFGSYAKGNATSESDIDVVVQLAKPNLLTLSALKQELQESFNELSSEDKRVYKANMIDKQSQL